MSKLIDNLIKKYEYNIYINENISGEKLDKLALLLEKEENNTETYFNPLRYKSKFSWFNILYIIERMSYTRKLEYIPFLIELLQDANWPTFEYTVSLGLFVVTCSNAITLAFLSPLPYYLYMYQLLLLQIQLMLYLVYRIIINCYKPRWF